jgi:hypothetical protein
MNDNTRYGIISKGNRKIMPLTKGVASPIK